MARPRRAVVCHSPTCTALPEEKRSSLDASSWATEVVGWPGPGLSGLVPLRASTSTFIWNRRGDRGGVLVSLGGRQARGRLSSEAICW